MWFSRVCFPGLEHFDSLQFHWQWSWNDTNQILYPLHLYIAGKGETPQQTMHLEECLQGILMVNILQTWIETRLQYILSDWFKPIPNVSCRLALIWLAEWMEFMGIMHCTRQIKTSSFSNKGEGRLHTGKPSTVFKALSV